MASFRQWENKFAEWPFIMLKFKEPNAPIEAMIESGVVLAWILLCGYLC